MFDFIKRIKERRLAKAKAKRDAYQARKAKIDSWHQSYWSKQYDKKEDAYKEALKEAEKKNSVCPKCGSTNVVNHIRRNKGELHGEGEISGGFSLFGGSVYGHSNIDGKLDTLPVCKCNDCGNEWYLEVPQKKKTDDEFDSYYSSNPERLVSHIHEYLSMRFNPKDLDETCNSLEEKREEFVKRWNSGWPFDLYRTCPRYMIDVAVWEGMHSYWKKDELESIFGYDEDLDQYSYRMSDKLWEVVKLVIGWKGTEE